MYKIVDVKLCLAFPVKYKFVILISKLLMIACRPSEISENGLLCAPV